MQVEIKMDDRYKELKIIILTAAMTEEVNTIFRKLSAQNPLVLTGVKNGRIEILSENDLLRIYTGGGKVFAVTENGEYTLRLRLYEIEERLDPRRFIRISNSEIVNLKNVKNFDLNLTGTICMEMINNTTSYVSRRYVSKIKKVLGI